MDAVRQCDHFCFPVACKFQCFQRTHRVTRKTDPDDHIFFIDPDQLFKNLTGTVRIDQRDILTYQIQIKAQKGSQRRTASDSDHINPFRI